MDQTARRRRRNLIQNIAIALLSVSAVLLFAQLQLYNLGTSEDPLYLERLTGEGSPSRLREFPAPVRVVLTDSYGRYASLGFTTNSDGFSALGLREALGSVQHLAPSTTDAFRGALSGPSIYFDFLNPLPLQVLAELTGAEGTALEGNARCLLLAAGADGSVHLYVWDGADTVLTGTVASTALSIDSLTEAVSQSGMGSVSFAFEVVEMEPLYGKLFPSPSCRRSYRSCRSSLPLHPSPARTGCWRLSASTSTRGSAMRRPTARRSSPRSKPIAPFTSVPPGRSPTAAEQMLRWRSPHRRRSPLRRKPCWVPVSCWNS